MRNAALALALFLLVQLASSAAALLAVNAGHLADGGGLDTSLLLRHPEYSGMALFFGQLLLIALLWLTRLVPRRPLRPAMHIGAGGWLCVASATLLMSVGSTLLLAPLGLSDGGMMETFAGMKGNVLCLLLLCCVGPLAEELLFRSAVLGNLRRSGLHPAAAVMVSAVAFAAVHGNWAQAVPAALGGLLFGTFYVRAADLRPSVLGHVVNNSLAVVALFVWPEMDAGLLALPAAVQVSAGIVLLAGAAALAWLWWNKTLQPTHENR